MDSTLHRFRDKFTEEANGLLDRLEKDLLDLENKPADQELVESAFRAMHTIKGVSGMFGFDFICEFTHHMESIYQSIREEKLQFNKDIFEITFQSVDHIRKLLLDEKLSDAENQKRHNTLIDNISKIIETKSLAPSGTEKASSKPEVIRGFNTWHILLQTNEKMFFRGISLINIFKELSALGSYEITRIENLSVDNNDIWSIFLNSEASEQEIREVFLFIDDDCTIVNLAKGNILGSNRGEATMEDNVQNREISILDYIEDPGKQKNNKLVQAKDESEASVSIHGNKVVKRISVDSAKLDHLMFLVSELITVNSQLNLSAREIQFNKIRPYLEKVDVLAKQFRNNALEIRLVPLGDTVLRFQRLIRDLSKQLNKQVNFITQGTNTELDKNTIDQLAEPLMHIIRNCIDHGIESPEVRAEKGKPEQGSITMSAYNSGNNVFISISDDGSGIDTEKVVRKAIDKGYLKATDKPDKKEIFDLIFLPGFSTANSLTEVSGRGVGMDIVKKRINDLRGEVILDSEPGVGTTFTLKLQQSLSIIDSLLFKVGDNHFIVPISEIEICTQMETSDINRQRHTSTLPFNDHLIPFVDLRTLFNLEGSYKEQLKVVIIKNNEKEMALLSDEIVGEHQAVLKPLGKSLRNLRYITSASQMGDGQMAFMIDTNTLLKNMTVSCK
jgi:two-component system, chemotaxis family, sensor kinase CheA